MLGDLSKYISSFIYLPSKQLLSSDWTSKIVAKKAQLLTAGNLSATSLLLG